MGFDNYISESEAISYAGVSQATLARFIEAGYLAIEQDADGLRLFSKTQLANLFGITEPIREVHQNNIIEMPMAKTKVANEERVAEEEVVVAAVSNGAAYSSPTSESPVERKVVELFEGATQTRGTAFETLDREVIKYKNIVELQEKILAMKDEEIKSLKGERDWLRTRTEKMEEKAERDQLLLLAETQTIRQLISIHDRRKSPVRAALEWLGFVNPEQQQTGTIEIKGSGQ